MNMSTIFPTPFSGNFLGKDFERSINLNDNKIEFVPKAIDTHIAVGQLKRK
jgi:hypothetical protein